MIADQGGADPAGGGARSAGQTTWHHSKWRLRLPELHPECAVFLAELANMDLASDPKVRYSRLCRRFTVEAPKLSSIRDTPPMRWYEPAGATAAILWLHGGRFVSGGLDTHDCLCRLLAYASRRTVIALNYRLAPTYPFPCALEDVASALTAVSSRCRHLAIGGDSAGACLAVTAALQSSLVLDSLVLIYPMLDATCHLPSHSEFISGPGPSSQDMRAGWDLWLPPGTDRRRPDVSPLLAADLSGLPRTYLLTTGIDSLRDEGFWFASHLASTGVPLSHTHLNDHIHGFLTYPAAFTAARETIQSVAAFLSAG